MPIESPLLDDLRYDRVVEELIRRIPVYAPEWTDYNESDPGITLIQLFAYLAEQVGYRLNRVPEKNHIELLKLLGVRLEPARAARSRVAFLLSDPAANPGFIIPAGTRITRRGAPPAIFETDVAHDTIPAEARVFLATKNPYLWDLLLIDDTVLPHVREEDVDPDDYPPEVPTDDTLWMVIGWDGKDPKLKDMPLEPVVMLPTPSKGTAPLPYLWVGLDFNDARDAGFLGVTVTLTVQLDDDEQPDASKTEECAPVVAAGEVAPPAIDWLAYYDSDARRMATIPGRIIDSTEKLTRSGTIRFTIPFTFGPIDQPYANLREQFPPEAPGPADICNAMTDALIANMPGPGAWNPTGFATALTNAVDTATGAATEAVPALGHPLDPRYRDPTKIKGWLRIGPLGVDEPSPKVRHIGFNVVPVTHAETVNGLLLGRSDGRPGQVFKLGHDNVFADTLEIGVAESTDPSALLTSWVRVDSLDGAGPFDRVYELDAEAGVITFGDGQRGRIPPLVPRGGNVVAVRYRHGGGVAGESAVGTLTTSAAQVTGIGGVVNIVVATGGEDAETVEQAKVRARKELSTRTRAVTTGDFEWIALRTPDVRVARAIVVPRRRPLLPSATEAEIAQQAQAAAQAAAIEQPLCVSCVSPAVDGGGGAAPTLETMPPPPGAAVSCGAPLPVGPAGLDDDFNAPGVVTVVVVPDEPGTEPLPTPSFLRAVCRQLDLHRLVTTEIHVAPPQYFRICDVTVSVKARPGYSRLMVQELVTASLAGYLHVLEGGEDGAGAPFGGQVHIADLIARVFRTEGVERVEKLEAKFVRTKSNADPRTGKLVLCPSAANELDHVDLGAEETTSFDATSLALSTV